jgi:hypothetical protein
MEKENNEEIKDQDINEDYSEGGASQWFRDNLRIIISVLIVVIIAGGIYSYSKRSEAPATTSQTQQDNSLGNIADGGDNNQSNQNATSDNQNQAAQNQAASDQGNAAQNQQKAQPSSQTSSVATSQETEKSFVETAARGDSTTRLARHALANYLEKNPDSALTPEHKIFIEDYLVKNSGYKGRVTVGSSVEFQKDLIQKAIAQSKNLSAGQLKNLHKYAVQVPSLS